MQEKFPDSNFVKNPETVENTRFFGPIFCTTKIQKLILHTSGHFLPIFGLIF